MVKPLYQTILTLGVVLFLSATVVSAQSVDGGVTLYTTPSSPEPFEEVSFHVESNFFDLNGSIIEWYVNDALFESARGATEITVETGGVGDLLSVRVLVQDSAGRVAEDVTSLVPSDVDLIWQAPSYVPPFYEGKALRPPQGKYQVVAVTNVVDENGAYLPREEMVYTWRYNGRVRGNKSGYGAYIFEGEPSITDTTISVSISTTDGRRVATRSVVVPATDPEILAYEHHPLYGILFNRELPDEVNLRREEMTIGAYPFYFAATDLTSPLLDFVWRINRRAVENTSVFPHALTLRYAGTGGTARIEVEIEHQENLFQTAEEWRLFILPEPNQEQ